MKTFKSAFEINWPLVYESGLEKVHKTYTLCAYLLLQKWKQFDISLSLIAKIATSQPQDFLFYGVASCVCQSSNTTLQECEKKIVKKKI